MDIAVDVDGCGYSFVDACKDWHRGYIEHLIESLGVDAANEAAAWTVENPATCWDFPLVDWGMKDYETFGKYVRSGVYAKRIFWLGQPDPEWVELLSLLRAEGHRVHLTTNRSVPGSKAATEAWLTDHDIEYDSLIFTKDKTIVSADLLIEDNIDNILAWSFDRPVIVWRQPWNDELEVAPGIFECQRGTRVADIMHTIRALEAAKHFTQDVLADLDETVLEEAQRIIFGDRNADYGHPLDDFTKTAGMLNGLFGAHLEDGFEFVAEHIPLIMNIVKMSREMNAPKRDNVVDGAGYWGTLQMVKDERVRRDRG